MNHIRLKAAAFSQKTVIQMKIDYAAVIHVFLTIYLKCVIEKSVFAFLLFRTSLSPFKYSLIVYILPCCFA